MEITKEIKDKTEKHFPEVCKRDGIKYGSKKFFEWQRMYFCGAMTVSHYEQLHWALCLASNRPIINPY